MKCRLCLFYILVSIVGVLNSQTSFTRKQIYNFQVGDVLQTRTIYSVSLNTYPYQDSLMWAKILNKVYSITADTVTFTLQIQGYNKVAAAPSSTPPPNPYIITNYNTTITRKYVNLSSVASHTNIYSTCLTSTNVNVSFPITTCGDSIWSKHYKNCGGGSTWNDSSYYYKRWGGPYYYFNDAGVWTSYHKILYHKSGNDSCGNYVLNVNGKTMEFNKEITVFPNPSSDFIFIASNFEIEKIEIVSVTGQTVKSQKVFDPINIADLSPGVYFVFVEDKNNYKYYRKIEVIKK